MPKKVIYTREEIIEKAYEMLKSEGLNQITARTLAKKLKTSPAPIYGHFDSMEVLKDELVKKARERFLNYIIKNYTEKPFLNAGMGFVIFAREESELFRAVFLMGNSDKEIILEFKDVIFSEVEKDERFKKVEEEKKEWLAGNTDVTIGSDAFFPFGDNIERAYKSGVKYVAQPGGSVRDDQVIETANKRGMAMCFTGMRLFHH